MKIIVSHDVDHLFRNDHYRDLIYPKLWVRSTIEFIRKECTFKEWCIRLFSIFNKKRHFIPEVMNFDSLHGVPSTFFFGMSKGLGMSYGCKNAKLIIKSVEQNGFDVGVHGICYDDFEVMKEEFSLFEKIVCRKDFGIRMHYVRYDDETFSFLNECGYLYDTSEFDKTKGTSLKAPYKVDRMWEFPLTIMDGYLPSNLDGKKNRSIELLKKAEELDLPYVSILFHDCFYNDGYSPEKEWYEWIIEWLIENEYEFISYKEAIMEMERKAIMSNG